MMGKLEVVAKLMHSLCNICTFEAPISSLWCAFDVFHLSSCALEPMSMYQYLYDTVVYFIFHASRFFAFGLAFVLLFELAGACIDFSDWLVQTKLVRHTVTAMATFTCVFHSILSAFNRFSCTFVFLSHLTLGVAHSGHSMHGCICAKQTLWLHTCVNERVCIMHSSKYFLVQISARVGWPPHKCLPKYD